VGVMAFGPLGTITEGTLYKRASRVQSYTP
jgi:hypothetical protein